MKAWPAGAWSRRRWRWPWITASSWSACTASRPPSGRRTWPAAGWSRSLVSARRASGAGACISTEPGAIHHREIHIHARLHQLRGYHQASLLRGEYLRQFLPPVRRAHQRGKMHALLTHRSRQLNCVLLLVHNRQHASLRMLPDLFRQYRPCSRPLRVLRPTHSYAAPRHGEQRGVIRYNLRRVRLCQQRLRGRTVDRAHSKPRRQPVKRILDRLDQPQRKGLYLLQNYHAFRHVVQLAKITFVVCVKRLKETHARGHHDGPIPVFGAQTVPQILLRGVQIAVVLQHGIISEYFAIFIGSLIDDAREWNHNNDAAQTMLACVRQRK